MSDIAQEQASALVKHFAAAASTVLSQIAGTALAARTDSLETATEAATLIRIDLSGALEGFCEIAISAPMTAHFAALLTGETLDPAAEISSDTREAAAELFQQICGNAADRLRLAFGPLELKPHLAVRDPMTGERQRFLITREDGVLEFELHILRLIAKPEPIAAPQPVMQPPAHALEQAAPLSGAASSAALAPPQFSTRNLDLLLDIELGVTLRFGTRRMLLKDIIELCSGSVVELDRRVQEPVDLLIDGRLIAQGEVVIVEGNYGIRVLQVATQGEKLACLP